MEDVAAGLRVVALRTPTLPPATHTNTYLVGHSALTVVDPATPYDDEQDYLHSLLESLALPVERILLTHHHHDHIGGVEALRAALGPIPVAAHAATAERLTDVLAIDELIEPDQRLSCGGRVLRALFTPGHAPGHLVFHDEDSGAVIAGDMVAGVGTILIDQRDGNLGLYLDSLERMRSLGASVLLPAHGPALHQADAVLSFYIAHRHQRSEQVRRALTEHGAMTPAELVPHVYSELAPKAHPIAAVQLRSHLDWLVAHGTVRVQGERFAVT